jgi:CheY-like chemotaxis protein
MSPEFQQRPAESHTRTVLVAEDNFDTRWSIAEFLRMNGYRVVEAMNSTEAIAVLCSGTAVDLVFSDVYMPGGFDGFALAQWIAKQRPQVSVLITSGAPAEGARAAAQGLEFLEKPYDLAVLLRKIELALQTRLRLP